MPGRPKRRKRLANPPKTAYSAEVHAQIVDWLKRGNYFDTACAASGVDTRTARRWLRDGSRIAQGRTKPDASRPWLLPFYQDVVKAQAEAEDAQVKEWFEATEWTAKRDFLERRHPKKWGKRINVTIEEELDAVLKALEAGLTSREFEKVLAIIVATQDAREADAAGDEV